MNIQPTPSKVCILSLSTIHKDGRVLRQIEYASQNYEVTVIGWGKLDKPRPGLQMLPVQKWVFPPHQRILQGLFMLGGRLTPSLWERWYWRKPDHQQALDLVLSQPFDLIHVDEAIALPIAARAAATTGATLLFDAHEYSTEHRANNLLWRILAMPLYRYIITTYAPQANAMTTVAPGIAAQYRQEYGLDAQVIMNTPYYKARPFQATNPQHIRMIHHGTAIPERRLEQMIEVVALCDQRYTLDFMLLADQTGYIDKLKSIAHSKAPGRIRFRPPVAPHLISETISAYDIGLFLIPSVNFSYAHALPNKFFEFIMAGLAVAIGPSVEMASICQQHDLGIVADTFDPTDLARRLNALSANDLDKFKSNALLAAKTYNADIEMEKLMNLYRQLLSQQQDQES